jgi:hypothetical protein
MIIHAEIISQPCSGECKERIYDIESSWNSQSWTFIKFIEDDYTEWCGQFRGAPNSVQISNKHQLILILTSDYLFQLNSKTADIIEFEDQPQYQNLILTPDENFLIADYMNIEKITNCIKDKKLIKSPIEMDFIEFKVWNENILEFTCDEFVYWDKHYLMTYNNITEIIEIKNVT